MAETAKMKDVFIDHLSFALGAETSTVEEAADKGRTRSSASILKEAGFRQHHTCSNGTTAYDLAKRAVDPIRNQLDDIGAIVYSTCIPINGNIGDENKFIETKDVKHLMDFPASHIQSEFGLDRAMVVGLNQQACTGLLGSLRLARMMLHSEPELGRVLCVTADRFPSGALYEQSYNLISDGAAACIVSMEPEGFRLVACHGLTNGALAWASDDEAVGSFFSYTHRVIHETLAKADLTMEDIAWVFPQNMNIKAWQVLARMLPIDFERVYFESIGDVAHLISGDNVVNLKRATAEGRIQEGERVLLVMAGYGLNWQCVVLEKR